MLFCHVALSHLTYRFRWLERVIDGRPQVLVQDGKVNRNAKIRVVRDGIVVAEDEIHSLRRFKDDVKEVAQGYECGIALEKFADIKEGDIFEAFELEEYRD